MGEQERYLYKRKRKRSSGSEVLTCAQTEEHGGGSEAMRQRKNDEAENRKEGNKMAR